MILQLTDGREITMPECIEDETARRFKRAFESAEQNMGRAKAAALLKAAQDVFIEARDGERAQAPDGGSGTSAVVAELRRVRAAILADRVLVADEIGEMTRSKAVLSEGGRE